MARWKKPAAADPAAKVPRNENGPAAPPRAVVFAAVKRVARSFMLALPPAAVQAGHHVAPEGGEVLPVPDGVYRLDGTDWSFTFRDGVWTEATRLNPPDFGGAEVIVLPNV